MNNSSRIVLIGGHGKVGLLAAGTLRAAGYSVDSVIRNPDHGDDVRKAGGNPVALEHYSIWSIGSQREDQTDLRPT